MQQLVVYDAACRAVAEAKSIDEVKEIGNRMEAVRAYARQAKNRQLELDALEIRVRAERRMGEILRELRNQGVLRVQGVRDHTERGKHSPLRLADLGIDGDESARAQRLAGLPGDRFETEMVNWRRATEVSQRVEVPLQHVRIPSVRADRARAAARAGRARLIAGDPFGQFVSVDGRRVADWRAGELERLEVTFSRLAATAAELRRAMPVATPDPLASVEAVFKREELLSVLQRTWSVLPQADAGAMGAKISASRASRTRVCEHCSRQFVMRNLSSSAGRFCSRVCSTAFRVEACA